MTARIFVMSLACMLLCVGALSGAAEEMNNTDQGVEQSAPSEREQPRVNLPTAVITGSDELPKVLYILPWRNLGEAPDLHSAPEFSQRGLFEPLDPETHARLMEYRRLLTDTKAEEN